jgi:regulatory protein
MGAAERASCYDQACRFLGFRDHSAHELAGKLRQREYTEEEIADALVELTKLGYINDQRYCENYAAGRVNRSRLGPRRVALDLKRKGFGDSLIQKTVDELFGQEDRELECAILAAVKKAVQLKPINDHNAMRKKMYDYLTRRGFSAESARTIALDRFNPATGSVKTK